MSIDNVERHFETLTEKASSEYAPRLGSICGFVSRIEPKDPKASRFCNRPAVSKTIHVLIRNIDTGIINIPNDDHYSRRYYDLYLPSMDNAVAVCEECKIPLLKQWYDVDQP